MQPIQAYTLPTLQTVRNDPAWSNSPMRHLLPYISDHPATFPQEILALIEKEAEGKGPDAAKALNLLAILYLHGHANLSQDVQKAVSYLQRCKDSDYLLAAIYFRGMGNVARDTNLAMQYLESASNQNHAYASLQLGLFFWEGAEGIAQDRERAKIHFGKASSIVSSSYLVDAKVCGIVADYLLDKGEEGNAFSFIEKADAVKQSALWRSHAYKLLQKGYNSSVVTAWQSMLKTMPADHCLTEDEMQTITDFGHLLYNEATKEHEGDHGRIWQNVYTKDLYQKAVQCFKRASDGGSIQARYYLGLAYCSGNGVKKDVTHGRALLSQAATRGHLPAKVMLEGLDAKHVKKVPSQIEACDKYNIASNEERHAIEAKKSFLGKAWSWLKKNPKSFRAMVITVVAIAAIAAGITALTVLFPHVMIPIFIVGGIIGGAALGLGGLMLLGFAAGSGDFGRPSRSARPFHLF